MCKICDELVDELDMIITKTGSTTPDFRKKLQAAVHLEPETDDSWEQAFWNWDNYGVD